MKYLHAAPDEAADEVEAEDEADEAIAGPIPDGPPEATLDSGSSFAPGVPPD